MTPEQEEEWLTHIAAGTDPVTAFAALPEQVDRTQAGTAGRATGRRAYSVLAMILLVIAWLVFWR